MELHKLQDQYCNNTYFYQYFTQHSREADLGTQQIPRMFSIIIAAARRIEGDHLSSKTDRVDLPDCRYTLVLEGGDEGANQSLEGPKANLASEGKPQIINPSFKFM
jgi:hypothetical protein